MADFNYRPREQDIERLGPPVLVTIFEDQSESLRRKSSSVRRRFRRRYQETVATTKTMLDFAYTKLTDTPFTILTFDERAVTPDTETLSVRLEKMPTSSSGPGMRVETEWLLLEVL